MARPKAFDAEQVLDAAVGVYREHGFEGTSTDALVQAMGIGRQSLYDTFGDKWQLYLASVRCYVTREARAHVAALRSKPRAIDGIEAMIGRVVATATETCLGVNSICEFGTTKPELTAIHQVAAGVIREATVVRLREAQADGDVAADLDPDLVAAFIGTTFAGIRIAARAGSDKDQLKALGQMALRALR